MASETIPPLLNVDTRRVVRPIRREDVVAMRVAFAGTHRTGKTTLLEAMATCLPEYEVVGEPYRALEDEGYEFSDPPSVEDFKRQLRLEDIRGSMETLDLIVVLSIGTPDRVAIAAGSPTATAVSRGWERMIDRGSYLGHPGRAGFCREE